MRKVEPNGFSIAGSSAIPFTIAPIACSRIPNGTLRPACVAANTPAPSNSVFVDSTRSAAPPIIVGVNGFSACITVFPASRVATSLPAGNAGSASSQPSRGHAREVELALGGHARGATAHQAASRSSQAARAARAALGDAGHVRAHLVGHDEGRVGVEPEHLLRRADLGLAERRAVRLGGAPGVGRRVRDLGAQHDQRGPDALRARRGERGAQRVEVVRVVDVLHVPAVGLEARALVLAVEAERGRAVDRDPVVVVDVDEPAEAELPGDRRGLLA